MAKQYELTQNEVRAAYNLGISTVLSLVIKFVLDAQQDREAGANEIEQAVQSIIHQFGLSDVPDERHDEFRRAAKDKALDIVKIGRKIERRTGTSHLQ